MIKTQEKNWQVMPKIKGESFEKYPEYRKAAEGLD